MSKFTVIVDPDLKPILPRYMEIRLDELGKLEQAVRSGDSEAVRLLGHKLKGTGASYGFHELTTLGASIEISGRENDIQTASKLTTDVRNYLENVEIVYGE